MMAGLGMVMLLLIAAALLLMQASVAASRASTAADLSALAAADAARGLKDGDPCEVAAATAARHEVQLVDCIRTGPQGHIVEVHTSLESAPVLPAATGRARAGPPP